MLMIGMNSIEQFPIRSAHSVVERERHVLRQIASGQPLPQVLEGLLLTIEEQSGHGMRTSVLFVSEDGKHLKHGAAPSLPDAYNAAIDGIDIGEGIGSCGTVASRGTPVYASDVATDPLWTDFRDLALEHGLRACWSTPILAIDGTMLGTFAIYYNEPRSPTREDIDTIAEITQTASLAIERHRSDLEKAQATVLAARTVERDRFWKLSQELLVIAKPDGLLEAVNSRWTALLGWTEDELLGSQFVEYTHPDDLEATLAAFASIFEKPLTEPYAYRFRHKDGSYRWFGWTGAFEDGKVYASGRDLTMEREQADALRQSQKMEAVGQLTGGLAHDFNNLLAGISGSLELMQVRMQQGRILDVERYIAAAQGAARRAAALTHRLLALSRRQTLDPKPTVVNRLVADMHEMIQRSVGPGIPV